MFWNAQSAIVVGGSRGIGLAISQMLAKLGSSVAICSLNESSAVGALQTLDTSQNQSHSAFAMDVRNPSEIDSVFATIARKSKPTVLINSAGINSDQLLILAKRENIENQIAANLTGTIFACKSVLKYMLSQRSGVIINISSVAGYRGNAGQSVYGASKAGVVGLTHSLAREMAPKGIRVNCIAPGYIDTDMTQSLATRATIETQIPLARFGRPEEVAHAVKYLIEAEYVTGHTLVVDGGLSA